MTDWGAGEERAGELGGVEQPALAMGEHRPEPFQGFRRNPRAEKGNVPFQIGPDETFPQGQAVAIVLRQVAVGKAPAQPESVNGWTAGPGLGHGQGSHVHILDPARQALPRLAEQVNGGGAKDEEAAFAHAFPPSPVDHAPQGLEEFRRPVDLIENHKPVFETFQEEGRILQLAPVVRAFQVEVERRAGGGDFQGKRRLSHLPGADQGHRRLTIQ